MSAQENPPSPRSAAPLLEPGHTFASVTDKISSIVLTRPAGPGWYLGFAISFALTMTLFIALAYLILKGTGIWGIQIPIGWGLALVYFVWWDGICRARAPCSALLLLLHQERRTPIHTLSD